MPAAFPASSSQPATANQQQHTAAGDGKAM